MLYLGGFIATGPSGGGTSTKTSTTSSGGKVVPARTRGRSREKKIVATNKENAKSAKESKRRYLLQTGKGKAVKIDEVGREREGPGLIVPEFETEIQANRPTFPGKVEGTRGEGGGFRVLRPPERVPHHQVNRKNDTSGGGGLTRITAS